MDRVIKLFKDLYMSLKKVLSVYMILLNWKHLYCDFEKKIDI